MAASYRAGDAYFIEFTTSNASTGAVQDADSLPVATANHNGGDDALFGLTVAHLDTGRYRVTGTIPAGYQPADVVNVTVAATVASVAGKALIDSFMIERTPFDDPYIQARIYGPVDPLDAQGRQVFYSPPNAADGGGVAKVRFTPTNPRGGRVLELDPSV